jgi:hypothetical protein
LNAQPQLIELVKGPEDENDIHFAAMVLADDGKLIVLLGEL